MELPELNSRVRKVIDIKAHGSVNGFAYKIGISQQKINRFFNVDSRTQKYPTVTADVLIKIVEMFVDIDPRWLLTGEGEMIVRANDEVLQLLQNRTEKSALEMIRDLATENALLKKENEELKNQRRGYYGSSMVAEP